MNGYTCIVVVAGESWSLSRDKERISMYTDVLELEVNDRIAIIQQSDTGMFKSFCAGKLPVFATDLNQVLKGVEVSLGSSEPLSV